MSGSYGQLDAKYNTLYALYLQLQTDISGGGILQSVLDAGNNANDIGIKLTDLAEGLESNYSNTGINFIDNGFTTTNIQPSLIGLAVKDTTKQAYFNTDTMIFADGDLGKVTRMTLDGMSNTNVLGSSFSLNPDGLSITGTEGQVQSISNGLLQIQDTSGKYIGLTTTSGININGSSGTEGQVLSKDATTNEMVWADTIAGWIGNATSQLDMNAFDITSLGIDDANMTLSPNLLNFKNSLDPDNHISSNLAVDYLQYLNKVDGNITLQANYASSGITLDNMADTTQLVLNTLSMREYSTQNNMDLTPNSFKITRPEHDGDGVQSFSLFQPNDTACVNYTDALNATQCVISSLGIINSGVVNGDYQGDISHYSREDMKLTTTILDEVNTLTAVGNQITMTSASNSAYYANTGITTFGSYSINTTDGLKLQGATSTEGQVITANSAGNPVWTDATGGWIGTATSNLDMSNYDITNIANIITTTETNLQGQFVFDTPPHIPIPILANDATPKGYVDSLVGQYAGGFNLFFNYSQTDGTFKVLSQIVSSSVGEIVDVNVTTGNNFIAQFITEPLGIDTIPVGLWDALIYGAVDNTAGDTHYYYELWKKTALNADTLIGTSGNSPDVNASPNNNPTSYSMTLTISTAIPLLLTDRLYIILYANKTGGSTTSLSTHFEGNYYSFIQTSLNAGTTLLSSNNTWTGNNDFLLPPTTPNQVGTPADTDIVNYGTITNLIGDVPIEPIVSTTNIFLSTINSAFQYPPAEPPSTIINTYQYYGWYFINAVAGRKIDWYYPPSKNMLVSDILGLYMNFFNITTTDPANLPFISVYTKPTGSGDAIPFFAHSIMTYSLYDGLPINPFLPIANTAYCAFMNKSGTQPNPFAYGHTIQNMVISPVPNNPRGTYLPTEEVAYISVGSNSTSAVNQVNFVMSKVGICLANGNQENILNPQNILSPSSTWVGTATSQLNMGAFDVSGTRMDSLTTLSLGNVSATTTTLGRSAGITAINGNTIGLTGATSTTITAPTINLTGAVKTANVDTSSAVALNLAGTTASGVNVGRLTQTTDLIGNVKINNSAGTSGQVLTSTGASTAPTWQSASAGTILPTYTQAPAFISVGMAGSAYRQVYNNTTFLDVPCPSITASYLITGQLSVNSSGATTNLFVNLGVRTGGGAQTDATLVKSAFNNTLMSVSPNTTFSQTNSLAQCSVAPANLFNKLSFSIVYTPASVNTFSYAIWFGTNGGGSGTIHSLIVRQITA